MSKIVHLHRWKRNTSNRMQPIQLELFADEAKASGIAAYFDVAKQNQDDLLLLLVQKSIRVVLDIRASKALPRLTYDHAGFFDYLYVRNIVYVDLENELKEINNSSSMLFWFRQRLSRNQITLYDLLKTGPCLVLYNSTFDRDALIRFRSAISGAITPVSTPNAIG
ncbi:MAG TPA: hypothetical protein VEB64_06725 [Azospirillaceae bacterium]|nr:hypothetical protein [Azospirillaceae bacterium]